MTTENLNNEASIGLSSLNAGLGIGAPPKAGFSTATFTRPTLCKHGTGWYVNVKFWIFKKRIFVCSKCGTHLDA